MKKILKDKISAIVFLFIKKALTWEWCLFKKQLLDQCKQKYSYILI